MGIEYWIMFMIGVVAGSVIANIFRDIRTAFGTLKIDHSNPEKDLYRFEIDDLDSLNKKAYVRLKIEHNSDLSQQ